MADARWVDIAQYHGHTRNQILRAISYEDERHFNQYTLYNGSHN